MSSVGVANMTQGFGASVSFNQRGSWTPFAAVNGGID
jgi:hypothetical protein